SYALGDLVTPGDYRLVFRGPQLRTVDVSLGPGEKREVNASCAAATTTSTATSTTTSSTTTSSTTTTTTNPEQTPPQETPPSTGPGQAELPGLGTAPGRNR
ncbi:MAG TPA: hypothetical protein VGL92_05200, partial [Acidimicrobiia bacterium]